MTKMSPSLDVLLLSYMKLMVVRLQGLTVELWFSHNWTWAKGMLH